MIRSTFAFAAALLAPALLGLMPAWALPAGSYGATCSGVSQRDTVLSGRCKDRYGFYRATSLDTRGCVGLVTNNNGALTCDQGRPREPVAERRPPPLPRR